MARSFLLLSIGEVIIATGKAESLLYRPSSHSRFSGRPDDFGAARRSGALHVFGLDRGLVAGSSNFGRTAIQRQRTEPVFRQPAAQTESAAALSETGARARAAIQPGAFPRRSGPAPSDRGAAAGPEPPTSQHHGRPLGWRAAGQSGGARVLRIPGRSAGPRSIQCL